MRKFQSFMLCWSILELAFAVVIFSFSPENSIGAFVIAVVLALISAWVSMIYDLED